jgi:hypothetical protein
MSARNLSRKGSKLAIAIMIATVSIMLAACGGAG